MQQFPDCVAPCPIVTSVIQGRFGIQGVVEVRAELDRCVRRRVDCGRVATGGERAQQGHGQAASGRGEVLGQQEQPRRIHDLTVRARDYPWSKAAEKRS